MTRVLTTLALLASVLLAAPAHADRERVAPISDKPAYARWATPVVKIYVDPSLKGHGWNVNRAIRAWRVGPVDLKTVSDPAAASITVHEVPGGHNWWGVAHWSRLGGVGGTLVGCAISLGADAPARRRGFVAAHELGHCLGLPHINDPRSIMDVWSRPSFIDAAFPLSTPAPADLAWLEATYAPMA